MGKGFGRIIAGALALLSMGLLAGCLGTANAALPDTAGATSKATTLPLAWRVFFIPDQYRSGNYVCHSGHGTFRLGPDGTTTGTTQTWVGALKGTVRGAYGPDGVFRGESVSGDTVVGRSTGRLENGRGSGTWEEVQSGCHGTWVAEPKPERILTRPVYATPEACQIGGKPDLRTCDLNLPDGTSRFIALAQDLFDRDTFTELFQGAPPGYDRPDLAREAIIAFWTGALESKTFMNVTRRGWLDAAKLPYGALACLRSDYRIDGTDRLGRPLHVRARQHLCFQPLPHDGSRFVLLDVSEREGARTSDQRFDQFANPLLMSLRLP